VVENAPRMLRTAQAAREQASREIGAGTNSWRGRDGSSHWDVYVEAGERVALERWLASLPARDPQLEPDADHQIVLEEQTGWDSPVGRRPLRWRTYYVERRAALDSTSITDAKVTWTPSRRELSITIDSVASRLLSELTASHVGDKLAIILDDRVTSAPVVMSAITSDTIGLDASGLGNTQEEVEAVAAALCGGALRAPVALEMQDRVAARIPTAILRSAQMVLSILVGAVVLLAAGAVHRLALPFEAVASDTVPLAHSSSRRARLGLLIPPLMLTVLGPAVLLLGERLLLPGLDHDVLRKLSLPDTWRLSVLALGFQPILTAFLLVEVSALLVPRSRALRHGGAAGRARLGGATAVLALCLSFIQGWAVAVNVEHLSLSGPMAGLVRSPGLGFELVTTLTLTAGVCLLIVTSWLVGRLGLANGWSALLLAYFAQSLWRIGPALASATPPQLAYAAVLALTIVGATVQTLRTRVRLAAGPALRLPTCGIAPLLVPGAFLNLAAALDQFGLPLFPAGYWPRGLDYDTLHVALMLAFVGLLSLAFSSPSALLRMLNPRLRDTGPIAGLLPIATAASAAYLLMALGGYLLWLRLAPDLVLGAAPLAIATAITMDIVAEWRARSRHADLVEVWPIHHVHAAEIALEALAAADIPAHPRGAHHRALLHFFGPFVPITVHVPRDHVDSARRILADVVAT